jgi:Fe2+ transport system protein FeoA
MRSTKSPTDAQAFRPNALRAAERREPATSIRHAFVVYSYEGREFLRLKHAPGSNAMLVGRISGDPLESPDGSPLSVEALDGLIAAKRIRRTIDLHSSSGRSERLASLGLLETVRVRVVSARRQGPAPLRRAVRPSNLRTAR